MKGKTFLYTGLITVHIVFIVLFFDLKVHVGGDDSDYIVAAQDFWEGRSFPGWHGSLYPIVMSPLVAMLGINVFVLKVFSMLLVVGSFYFLHKAFHDRLPPRAYNFALAITACSYGFATYASTTYSEPLFLFLQSVILFVFVKILDNDVSVSLRQWNSYILLAFLVFCLSITRNIGFGAIIALALIFLINKKWKIASVVVAAFSGFHFLFSAYKRNVWNVSQSGIEGQFNRIGYRNFYDPSAGTEDLYGLIIRLWDNSNLYLSRHVARFVGVRFFGDTVSVPVTLLFFVLFVIAVIFGYKKNRVVLFMTLYVGIMLAATFVTLQTHWDQERLVLVYVTLIAAIGGCLLDSLVESKTRAVSVLAGGLMVALPVMVAFQSIVLPKNIFYSIDAMMGRPYSGYPVEWKNYAAMCEWVGAHVAEDKNVLCRKAGIARVYGERRFHGISNFYHLVPDSADALLARQKIDYVILDDLQMPTVRRLLTHYLQKYPYGLELEKTTGNSHASVLLKITRALPKDSDTYFRRVNAGLTVCPDQAYFYVSKGDLFVQRNEYRSALEYYSTALNMKARESEKFYIRFQCAKVLVQLRDFDRAQRAAEELVRLSPKDKNCWILLAYVHQMKGNQKEAQKYYSKSTSL